MRRYPYVVRTLTLAAGLALAAPPASAQQTVQVRGTVTDASSGALIGGAQVFIVGTGVGSLTDEGGTYSLSSVPAGTTTIRVEHIGYTAVDRTLTLTAGQTAVVDLQMAPTALGLDEIVVVGYGTRSRRELSTSVASVSAADIQDVPVAGIGAALQGKAPGLQVTQNAGNPGNGMTIRIRGAASLSASNQPLYVIDGVPILRDSYSQMGTGGQDITAISALNPDEIQSIDILKDAAAAAIYGSRASNGVVLITTKRGRSDTPSRVTFSAYTGVQDVPRHLPVLNAQEYVDFLAEAARNDGMAPPFTQEDIQGDTDWQEEIFRVAPVSNATLALSGGTERIQYYLSGSIFDQQGVMIGSGYNRVAGRVNVDFQATDRLSLSTSIGLSREDNNRVQNDGTTTGVGTNAIANPAILPVRWPDGRFSNPDDGLEYVNSVAMATFTEIESRTLRALGNVSASLDLGGGLSLRSMVGMDVLNLRDLRWDGPEVVGTYASSVGGVAQQGNTTANRYLLESYLSYDRPTGDFGALSLTGGASVERNEEEWGWLRGERFPSPQFRYAGNASVITEFDAGLTEYNLVSFFSRANYELKGRYFFSGAFRVDGSSRFGADNQYGIFPAASVGWSVGDEPFMEWLRPIGELKARASYGETGNQDLNDDYASLGRFESANYGDEPGIAPSIIANPNLKWETTREFDVGLDFTMFGGRIDLTADYYVKKTDDLLVSRPITSASGYTDLWDNIGAIENRGFEFSVNSINIEPPQADGLAWSTDFNISFNDNEVTELYRGEPFNAGIRSINRIEEGEPIGAFHAIRFEGVDPQTGDAIFFDANGDGNITSADRVIVGSPHADYTGGLGNTFSWGGFNLRTFLQFSMGAEIFHATRMFSDDGGYYFDNKYKLVLDRWQQPGDITNVPRASYDDTSGSRTVSSRYIEDASYLRIQEVTLSYTLPSAFASRLYMQNATFFVSGRNLHLFTDYYGYDPNVNSNGSNTNIALGSDYYAYPIPRTLSIGIRGSW